VPLKWQIKIEYTKTMSLHIIQTEDFNIAVMNIKKNKKNKKNQKNQK